MPRCLYVSQVVEGVTLAGRDMVVVMKHATRALLLLSCYGWAACASAKRLITFGDSITDNGNGTNSYVQAYFSQLLGQNITAVSLPLIVWPYAVLILCRSTLCILYAHHPTTCSTVCGSCMTVLVQLCRSPSIGCFRCPINAISAGLFQLHSTSADHSVWHGSRTLQAPFSRMGAGPMGPSGQVQYHALPYVHALLMPASKHLCTSTVL